MAHHSYVMFGRHSFLWTPGYVTDVAALFLESDRLYVPAQEDSDESDQYGYFATARELRQRLQVKGFNADRARVDVSAGIQALRHERSSKISPDAPTMDGWAPTDVDELIAVADRTMTLPADSPSDEFNRDVEYGRYVEDLWGHVTTPSLLRLLLEAAPDDSRTVSSFIAAGVANRFIAIADNDTESHAALVKLKAGKLPPNCRVTHYPDLELLASYPTRTEPEGQTVLADINGLAGSLEMYLGRDILTIDGQLTPVLWKQQVNPVLQRQHGTLADQAKQKVQQAFKRKVKRTLKGATLPQDDWTGTTMILNRIVDAFD